MGPEERDHLVDPPPGPPEVAPGTMPIPDEEIPSEKAALNPDAEAGPESTPEPVRTDLVEAAVEEA